MADEITYPTIWVLADDRAGNRAQVFGVAEKLGLPFDIKEIRYSTLGSLPNALRGVSLRGLTDQSQKRIQAPWPALVITAGRRCAPVARYIKKQSPKTRLVQLMWPDGGADAFDCIALPTHDREHKDAQNAVRTLGAPHRISPHLLMAARMKWKSEWDHLPEPRIAVLLGGSSKHGTFKPADFTRLGKMARDAAQAQGGSLLITTSRRTGDEGETAFLKAIGDTPHFLHSWKSKTKPEDNPYMGFLALADAVLATADSIAMCSEACATGKPVYLYQPDDLSGKHQRFANTLIATGYAFPAEAGGIDPTRRPMKKEPLDSAQTIANHIRAHLLPKT